MDLFAPAGGSNSMAGRAEAHSPDLGKYHDPNELGASAIDGSSLVGKMRSTVGGIKGTIIPTSAHGVPRGLRIHDVSHQVVHFDPHLADGTTIVLGSIDKDMNKPAVEKVAATVQRPPETLEDVAEISIAVMRNLHDIAEAGNHQIVTPQQEIVQEHSMDLHQDFTGSAASVPQPQPQPTPIQQIQQPPPATAAQHPAVTGAGSVSAVRSFFQTKEAQNGAVAANPVTPSTLQPPVQNDVRVAMELPGYGQLSVVYSDVVVSDDFLILVLADAEQNRFFPPAPTADSPEPKVALKIDRFPNVILLAVSTGIRYHHNGNEYCILVVEQEVPET